MLANQSPFSSHSSSTIPPSTPSIPDRSSRIFPPNPLNQPKRPPIGIIPPCPVNGTLHPPLLTLPPSLPPCKISLYPKEKDRSRSRSPLPFSGGGSSVSGSPTTGYLGGMGGGAGGHTPGSSSPGSEMSPQHNESPPAPSWPGEMKHHPHPHAPPHTHHHPHTPGHHPPPPPPPPHHAGYMPQYSWYQADPNPGLLT